MSCLDPADLLAAAEGEPAPHVASCRDCAARVTELTETIGALRALPPAEDAPAASPRPPRSSTWIPVAAALLIGTATFWIILRSSSLPDDPIPAQDPAADEAGFDALTAKLSSDDWAEREAASAALKRGGQKLLPRLRLALDKVKDEEGRSRLRAIVDFLERPYFETVQRRSLSFDRSWLKWSRDGKLIAATLEQKVVLIDPVPWKIVGTIDGPRGIVGFDFSPDSSSIATLEGDALSIRNLNDLDRPSRVMAKPFGEGDLVRFLDNDRIVYESAERNGTEIYVASRKARNWTSVSTGKASGFHMEISPDGRWFAHFGVHQDADGSLRGGNSLEIFDARTLGLVASLPVPEVPHETSTNCPCLCAFSPDSKLVAQSGDNGEVLVYRTGTWEKVKRWTPNGEGLEARTRFQFSTDSKHLITTGRDCRVRAWAVDSWLMKAEETLDLRPEGIASSPLDDRFVILAGPEKSGTALILRLRLRD